MELYLKYRPAKLSEVIGQESAIRALKDMAKRNDIPHALLFTGPSGTGKTTLARILRKRLKCSDTDFIEINAADFRGIDTIRRIREQVGAAPLAGASRVWLIDECHSLSSDAQNSFLKLLEDTPRHVYFMLATTDPHKLKKTIITRCTEIKCVLLSSDLIEGLVKKVAGYESVRFSDSVVSRIADVAEGSARKALVILHSILGIEDEKEQLSAIESMDLKEQAIQIARALMKPSTDWKSMSAIIESVSDDAESVRRLVLAYMSKVVLSGGKMSPKAALIIEEFRDHWYDCGKAGLVVSCWNLINRD